MIPLRPTPLRTRQPSAQRLLVGLQAFWLAFIIVLGAWWVYLMLNQAGRIVDLEERLGVERAATEGQLLRTHRMLLWEGATFFAALLVSLALLVQLYWRDTRRARALQGFFASVTHELRTPLASIRLQAESLADLNHADPHFRTLLSRLLDDTTRLETQVDRALELARVEGGGSVLTQPIGLAPAVRQIIDHWRPPLQRDVRTEFDVETLPVLADPAALQIILRNVLDNAAWHADTAAEPLRIRISSGGPPSQPTLSIRNWGKPRSIPPAQAGRLFEKGAQSRGAGVGLYLVRMLMQRMGGRAIFTAIDAPPSEAGFLVDLHFLEGGRHG